MSGQIERSSLSKTSSLGSRKYLTMMIFHGVNKPIPRKVESLELSITYLYYEDKSARCLLERVKVVLGQIDLKSKWWTLPFGSFA